MNKPVGLCEVRCYLGLTQKRLAEITGYSQTAISNWESNASGIKLDCARNLCQACNNFGVNHRRYVFTLADLFP